MFSPALINFQRFSPPTEDAINVVSEELLQTFEGRLKYYYFLENNPNIEPIRKIYGINTPLNIENNNHIEKHIKKMLVCVHPDTVGNDDKDVCTALFKIINNLRQECVNSRLEFSPFIPPCCSTDPKIQLVSFVEEEKWMKAKAVLTKIHKDDLIDNHFYAYLCTIVFVRLNDLESASEYSSIFSEKISAILRECNGSLIDFKNSSITIESKKEELLRLLGEMHRLHLCVQKEKGWTHLSTFIVPYGLYSALKECCRLLNDIFGYEKYLREAIRSCPNELLSEKQPLVEELKTWIQPYYKGNDLNYDGIMAEYAEKRISDMHQIFSPENLNLTEVDFELFANGCCQFLNNPNLGYLDELIQCIQAIIDRHGYPSWFSFQVYSPAEVIEQLKISLLPLSGIKNYMSGDKLTAASDFLMAKEYLPLGLLELGFCKYGQAIDSWQEYFFDKNQNSDPFYEKILNWTLIAMNSHDIGYGNMQLNSVDGLQKNAIDLGKTLRCPKIK